MHQIIGDIELDTNGPSLIDITRHIASWIKINKLEKGILNLYIFAYKCFFINTRKC